MWDDNSDVKSMMVAHIIFPSPDDGSLELKCYSVIFVFSINLSFSLDYLVINFSLYCQILLHYLLQLKVSK